MPFFNVNSEKVAVITKEYKYTYKELLCEPFHNKKKQLILILWDGTFNSLANYVTAMNSHHAVMLLSKETNKEFLETIITQFKPLWVIGLSEFIGYIREGERLIREEMEDIEIHENLALLLSTSGTTGSHKFVRLSYENLIANAQAIQKYLNITEQDRAILNLPLSYSYGMSIVNSHLLADAAIVLTNESVLQKSFWDFIKEVKATSFAGVPFTYQMLQRIGFVEMDLPDLRVLTQAGGRLNEKLVHYFAKYANEMNKRFYVMYGQTEASPRISYVPYNRILEKAGSIGIPIPGGKLELINDELVYTGENVMLGYAEKLSDLAKGDELNGILYTGDLATVDEDGYFKIIGRLKRFIKIFGLRINLDTIEKKLEQRFQIPLACIGTDEKLIIVIEEERFISKIESAIEELYHFHKSAYKVKVLDIPYLSNGKINYTKLKEICI